MASLSQGRTAAAQCGLFTHKSVPVIFEPPCTSYFLPLDVNSYIAVSAFQHQDCVQVGPRNLVLHWAHICHQPALTLSHV